MPVEPEMKGDGANDPKIQFEKCKYREQWKGIERNGRFYGPSYKCKYMDNNGYCIFENCKFDQEELPEHVTDWWFTCVVCHEPDSINPKHMHIHWCKSCIARANEAEVLPFTCRYCGKKQSYPSAWFMSRVCNSCIPKLYNPWCKNYWCSGCFC